MADEWVYLMATWKHDLGLFVYFNARLKATDPTGTAITGTQVIESNPNLSIGRNVRGPSFYYAKLQVSSFTAFNKFIPESDVVNVHMFFWSSCKYFVVDVYSDVISRK